MRVMLDWRLGNHPNLEWWYSSFVVRSLGLQRPPIGSRMKFSLSVYIPSICSLQSILRLSPSQGGLGLPLVRKSRDPNRSPETHLILPGAISFSWKDLLIISQPFTSMILAQRRWVALNYFCPPSRPSWFYSPDSFLSLSSWTKPKEPQYIGLTIMKFSGKILNILKS